MINVLDYLVEGYFLKTVNGLIFEVKGVVHPQDRIIAYLRYVPQFNSIGLISGYQKIYDLSEREKYLKKKFPQYLWFSETHQRILQAVPHEEVDQIFDPVKHMNQIRKETSVLSVATSNLVDVLLEYTEIDKMQIGVTGSQLIGVARETSDIDLIVFGESVCHEFYNKLREKYSEIPGITCYDGDYLKDHVRFRWGSLVEYQDILSKIESEKKLQGLFENHHFFIRLVKKPQDISERYGQIVSDNSSLKEVQCLITEDQDSIFTPCVYQVESSKFPSLTRIVSFRGRFTEHVSSGDSVNAKGRLENVTDTSTNERYQQLVVGERSSDYLIPR